MATALAFTIGAPALAQDSLVPAQGLAPYFVPATSAPKAPDEDGFLQRWLLLEPVVKPNRSNSGFTATYVRQAFATYYFPGQLIAVPRDGETIKAATPLKWHALDSTGFDVKLFNFAQGLGKPTYGVIFWAVTIVDSPREIRNVRLAVGSNSASMWWLNGKEVAGLFGDRRMVMDDALSMPLTLRKGRNVIRGAIINGPGLSDFCVRFVDAAAQPVRHIALVTR
ncbi:MAG: acetylxylan esterase [Sphingomicrobium sp.]